MGRGSASVTPHRGVRPRNPSGALQVKVSQLRRALDEAEPGTRGLVTFEEALGYRLRADTESIDAMRFTGLLARARRTSAPRSRAGLLTEALEMWRGPAFADFADAAFARPAAALLEEHRLTALEERAEARLETGEQGALADELGDLVARHPLRERLRSAYMRALYGTGRQSDALKTYTDLRTRLREELGMDPGPEITELHQRILEQDRALAAGPGPPPRTNLPAQISELVGRDEAVVEVRALLASARLVTLTGPGGVGKTRLALETAARAAADHPDGVWLVELAGLDRTAGAPGVDRLAETVIAVLGIRDDTAPGLPPPGPSAEPAARLADALRARRTLLVLDNCEHVIEDAAAVSDELLRAAPEVRILATSQEPLGLAGEAVWPVPPQSPHSPADHANLRGALEEAVRRRDADRALRLVNALAWYWYLRGRIGEGRRAFATALALTARRAGRLDDAEAHMRDVLARAREVRYAPGIALGLAELGFTAEQRGDAAAAGELHGEALAVARDIGDPRAIALALEGLAGAATLAGAPATAARHLGEAAALRASAGAPLPPEEHGDVDRITARARSAPGDDAFTAAFAEGHGTPRAS